MLRHSPSSGGLHGFRQAQELALEMVEGIFSVIQRSPVGERIVGIKQNGVQGAGDGEDPRRAYRPSDSRRSASGRFSPPACAAGSPR